MIDPNLKLPAAEKFVVKLELSVDKQACALPPIGTTITSVRSVGEVHTWDVPVLANIIRDVVGADASAPTSRTFPKSFTKARVKSAELGNRSVSRKCGSAKE
jgi:hypothetical protein